MAGSAGQTGKPPNTHTTFPASVPRSRPAHGPSSSTPPVNRASRGRPKSGARLCFSLTRGPSGAQLGKRSPCATAAAARPRPIEDPNPTHESSNRARLRRLDSSIHSLPRSSTSRRDGGQRGRRIPDASRRRRRIKRSRRSSSSTRKYSAGNSPAWTRPCAPERRSAFPSS